MKTKDQERAELKQKVWEFLAQNPKKSKKDIPLKDGFVPRYKNKVLPYDETKPETYNRSKKLTNTQRKEIILSDKPQTELAIIYAVSESTISKIKSRKIWW